jgi:hypothetical protein
MDGSPRSQDPVAPHGEPGAAAEDVLVFSISWAEQDQRATLVELRYNDRLVEEARVASPGKVSVAFRRPLAAIHRFSWDLFFPVRTLRNLEATAALNGAPAAPLDTVKDARDHWADRGDL